MDLTIETIGDNSGDVVETRTVPAFRFLLPDGSIDNRDVYAAARQMAREDGLTWSAALDLTVREAQREKAALKRMLRGL